MNTVLGQKKIGRRVRRQLFMARLASVQALYQMDITEITAFSVIEQFKHFRAGISFFEGGCEDADEALFRTIVVGTVEHQEHIDQSLQQALAQGWGLERLDATVRAILRAGGYELYIRRELPPKVILSEYMHVAYCFFSEKEPHFINGVLDSFARSHRGEEMGLA